MFKKALIAVLAAIVITAVSVGAYNLITARAATNNTQNTALAAVDSAHNGTPQSGTANSTVVGPQWQNNTAPNGNLQAGAANSTMGGPRWQNSAPQDGSNAVGQPSSGGQGRGRQGGGNSGNSNSGNGNRGNGAGNQAQNNPAGTPAPQNGLQEWVTFSGEVSNYTANLFTLVTPDGQQIPVQLGSQNYISGLGLSLQDGDPVTVVGFWETVDTFTAGTLTLDATGAVISLRDEVGRPLWAGGGRNR